MDGHPLSLWGTDLLHCRTSAFFTSGGSHFLQFWWCENQPQPQARPRKCPRHVSHKRGREVAIPIVCLSDTLGTNLRMYPAECIYIGISSQSPITNVSWRYVPGALIFVLQLLNSKSLEIYFFLKKKEPSTYVQGFAINRPFQPWRYSTSLIVAAVVALEQQCP